MKKTIVLMTIVLAILAAPVFAEVGTSGSVEFDWAWGSGDNYTDDSDASAAITLDGTISDYTSISAEFSADSDDDASLSAMTLTQDVTGAMGVMGPVSFGYTLGYMDYSPVDYSGVAPKSYGVIDATAGVVLAVDETSLEVNGTDIDEVAENFTTSNLLGAKLMFGLADMVDVDVAVYPTTLMSKEARGYYDTIDSALEMGINAYGTFGIVDASVYYVSSVKYSYTDTTTTPPSEVFVDSDGDPADEHGKYFGLSLAASPVEGVSVGFGLEFAPDQDYLTIASFDADGNVVWGEAKVGYYMADYALNVGYTAGPLAAGFGFTSTLSDNPATEDWTFMEASDIVLSAKYAVSEAVNVYASFDTGLAVNPLEDAAGLEFADLMDYEVGADVTFDGVTYALGYTLDNDFAAYEADFTDGTDNVGNVYVKISASF